MNTTTDPSRPLKLLVATAPSPGHTHPATGIVRELVRRGHEVRWLTGHDFEGLVTSTGATFEPLVDSYDPADGSGWAERFPERAALNGVAAIKFDLKHVFVDQIPPQVRDYQRVLASYDADLVVADTGFLGTRAMHELGGPRWVSIGVTPLPIPGRDVAPFGAGLPPVRGSLHRLRASVVSFLMRTTLASVEKHHQTLRATLGLPPLGLSVIESTVSPFLMLQTGTEVVDYPRSDLPAHIHYVGPLANSGAPSDEPTDWAALAAGRPLVVLTQGTVATSLDTLIGPGLRALADEDVFVVAIGGTAPAALPRNAVHRPYLSYEEVLPHAAAMVTNGGYGGVQIALGHGVPLAIAGTTEDKPEVAGRVAWSGAGINMRKSDPTEDEIRGVVRRLVDEPSYRDAAARVAADFARRDAPRRSADLIEQLARTGDARRLVTGAVSR